MLPYTCDRSPRRLQFVVAIFGFGCTMIVMGPSQLLHLPDNIWVIISAFPFLGLF